MIRSGLELPKHAGGTRNPHIDKSTLEWVGFNNDQNLIILIDDVITSGASFKACQQLIFENSPHTTVVGVFWARAIQAEGEI
jgi:orotate phosphoribosyltransferase